MKIARICLNEILIVSADIIHAWFLVSVDHVMALLAKYI